VGEKVKPQNGDVVIARFFADKSRPGVVVGNDAYVRSLVMACPVTSTLVGGPLRLCIEPADSGLKQPSEIMPHRLQSLPPEVIDEVVGRLPADVVQRLEDILLDLLGLEDACNRLST
jgi:mRNA-degrading endonuclease toxin of MazEF toxin-antitoxin module